MCTELLNHLNDGIYQVDRYKNIVFWNQAAEKITGYLESEVSGSCCTDNILMHVDANGEELCKKGCPLGQTLIDGEIRKDHIYLQHKDGYRVSVSIKIVPIFDSSKSIVGAFEVFTEHSSYIDILKEMEELKKEALIDALTQIGNRKFANATLNTRKQEQIEQNIAFGILFVDIDHFKSVNDTYGHAVGDDLLVVIANSIQSALRPLDVVCRWGGEEFLVIVPNVDLDALSEIGERIRMLSETSFLSVGETELSTTVSIGGVISPLSDSVKETIEKADKAMYQSKQSGRNRVTILP